MLSSPRDNEADHDDRPTSQDSPDRPLVNSKTEQLLSSQEQDGKKEAEEGCLVKRKDVKLPNHQLQYYLKGSPVIDVLINNKEFGILTARKKSEGRKVKTRRASSAFGSPKQGKLKRSGSAVPRKVRQSDFGKTFARMQIVRHMNHENGLQDTI